MFTSGSLGPQVIKLSLSVVFPTTILTMLEMMQDTCRGSLSCDP